MGHQAIELRQSCGMNAISLLKWTHFWDHVLGWKGLLRLIDVAHDDDEDETRDRRGTEGKDRAGGGAGAGDGGRSGPALRGSPEPDLCVEEATSGTGGAGL
jgi:hypothetical protein